MQTIRPSVHIHSFADMNITMQNSIPSHGPAAISDTPAIEELDVVDSLSLSVRAIKDIRLLKLRTQRICYRDTEGLFLHLDQVDKFFAKQIAALSTGCKIEHQAKRKKT